MRESIHDCIQTFKKSDNYILDLEFRCRFHNPNSGFLIGMATSLGPLLHGPTKIVTFQPRIIGICLKLDIPG